LQQYLGAGGLDDPLLRLRAELGRIDQAARAAEIGDELVDGDAGSGVVVEDRIVEDAGRDAGAGVGAGSGDAPDDVWLKRGGDLGGNLRGGVG